MCHSSAKIRHRRSKAYVKVKNLSLCHSVQKINPDGLSFFRQDTSQT